MTNFGNEKKLAEIKEQQEQILRQIKWKKIVGVARSRQYWDVKGVESRIGILFNLFSESTKKPNLNEKSKPQSEDKKLKKDKKRNKIAKLKAELAIRRAMDDLQNYKRKIRKIDSPKEIKKSQSVKTRVPRTKLQRPSKMRKMITDHTGSQEKHKKKEFPRRHSKMPTPKPKPKKQGRMKYSVRGYVKMVPDQKKGTIVKDDKKKKFKETEMRSMKKQKSIAKKDTTEDDANQKPTGEQGEQQRGDENKSSHWP